MSTDDQRAKRFVELVVSTGEQARRAAFGDAPRRGAGATAPGAFTAANEGFAGAADAGRQIARFAVRTAIDFGRLLESMLGEEPGAEGSAPSSSGDREAGGTAELQLPSSSRGESTSASFDVRNDGYDTVDALRLRCDGLIGEDKAMIPAKGITFDPAVVHVVPRGSTLVTCKVDVPRATKGGTYTGLITSPDRPGVRMLVTLTVI
jgi:hypothetical protein